MGIEHENSLGINVWQEQSVVGEKAQEARNESMHHAHSLYHQVYLLVIVEVNSGELHMLL